MPLTESEQAQYDAMQIAFMTERVTNDELRKELRELKAKLNKIVDLIEGDE